MDHTLDHDTNANSPEELRLSLDELEKPLSAAPARGVPKPLFITVTVLAIVLAVFSAYLYLFSRDCEHNMALANAGWDDIQQQLEAANADLTEVREELSRREAELAQAQDTIERLKEYSVAAPDGTVPEYTQLYPDMYVPAWEGERVDGGNVCCLTFDDGPSANTDQVLAILDRYGIKATFFVVGSAAVSPANQQRMKDIVAAGHTLAMHSWSHDYKKVYASVESFLDEFHSLYDWIYQVTGVYPSVYRFPGGSINGYDRGVYQEIIAEMTRRGFVYFDWNASAQDATAAPRPAWDITADCLKGVGKDLAVVLCHDSAARATTVEALPAVIEGYQAAGYTFSALHPGVRPITFGYPAVK